MSKLPDMSSKLKEFKDKIDEKINFQGIVDSVKSIINSDEALVEKIGDNPVVGKLQLIMAAAKRGQELAEQQQEELAKIDNLVSSIYRDLAPKTEGHVPHQSSSSAASHTMQHPKPHKNHKDA